MQLKNLISQVAVTLKGTGCGACPPGSGPLLPPPFFQEGVLLLPSAAAPPPCGWAHLSLRPSLARRPLLRVHHSPCPHLSPGAAVCHPALWTSVFFPYPVELSSVRAVPEWPAGFSDSFFPFGFWEDCPVTLSRFHGSKEWFCQGAGDTCVPCGSAELQVRPSQSFEI